VSVEATKNRQLRVFNKQPQFKLTAHSPSTLFHIWWDWPNMKKCRWWMRSRVP